MRELAQKPREIDDPALSAGRSPALSVEGIKAVYGRAIIALHDVSLRVPRGSIVALLGPNGAGKTTTLRAISGMLRAEGGGLVSGRIHFEGQALESRRPGDIVGMGIVQVPEGRRLFTELTVEENLHTGACRRPRGEVSALIEGVYVRFPRLKERRHIAAGYLSGGEQQMAAIGRALMARPRMLLLDEPSLGLAPQIVDQIFLALTQLSREEDLSVLLVEQNATKALSIADHGFVMENGRVVLSGPRDDLVHNDDIRRLYLGLSTSGQRRSFRDPRVPARG
jgi:branched-chain amino acid transport system ATP-binding protein